MRRSRFVLSDENGLVIDLFAGGGGASVGIEAAIGRKVDLAINHDATALAVHKANHPGTRHLEADIWEVQPRAATEGRPVYALWASPDCTHFSIAKGGKPRKQKIRSLANVVIKWARAVRPRLIFLENVSEFRTWGPLGLDGQPDKKRMGETFRWWLARLEKLGYVVEYRVLDASLYGAPTRRRRLFLIARCDGQPIEWPEATHGPVNRKAGRPDKGLLPLRTAAECIDWSLPCPSIFERSRPLAKKTLWRIAQGLRRFVLENPRPFIVNLSHGGRVETVSEPLNTVTAWPKGGDRTIVVPVVAGVGGRSGQSPATPADAPVGTVTAKNDRVVLMPALVEMNHANAPHGVDEPLGVVTTQHNRFNLLAPHLVKVNHGGDDARGEALDAPLSTVTATQRGHALIAPSLIKFRHDSTRAVVGEPLPTVTAGNGREDRPAGAGHALGIIAPTLIQTGYGEREGQRARYLDLHQPLGTEVNGQKHAIVAAHLSRQFGKGVGSEIEEPTPTVMPGGSGKSALVSAFLAKHYGDRGQRPGLDAGAEPLATITASDHHSLAAATLVKLRGECSGADIEEPAPTVTAAGFHIGEVRAFLTAYYGEDGTSGQSVLEPLRTVTAKARLGLVTVEGTEYQIVDIGMRMLEPHELLRAQFGRFAATYDISAAKTKAAKVRLIGNSVAPENAEAIVRANTVASRVSRRQNSGAAA